MALRRSGLAAPGLQQRREHPRALAHPRTVETGPPSSRIARGRCRRDPRRGRSLKFGPPPPRGAPLREACRPRTAYAAFQALSLVGAIRFRCETIGLTHRGTALITGRLDRWLRVKFSRFIKSLSGSIQFMQPKLQPDPRRPRRKPAARAVDIARLAARPDRGAMRVQGASAHRVSVSSRPSRFRGGSEHVSAQAPGSSSAKPLGSKAARTISRHCVVSAWNKRLIVNSTFPTPRSMATAPSLGERRSRTRLGCRRGDGRRRASA